MYKTIFKSSALAPLLLASALVLPTVAFAVDEHNVVSGLTAAGAPLGLHGVDPVASVALGNTIEGNAAYAAVHDGVAYYFVNQKNADTFKKNPDQYVPQNGGFCTYGVAFGKKFDGDPNYSSVIDGKLYVFLNEQTLSLYLKDKAGIIKKAKKQWKDIEHVAVADL